MNPLSSVVSISLKTQLMYSENIVPTKEGLNVELDVSLLYHIQPETVRKIYLALGEKYEDILILPELQSAVRGFTSEVNLHPDELTWRTFCSEESSSRSNSRKLSNSKRRRNKSQRAWNSC